MWNTTRSHVMSEQDASVETPPDEESPTPAAREDVSVAPQSIEPALGLAEFVAIVPMRMAEQAALRRWMDRYVAPGASYGHYELALWQEFQAGMRAHT
jgi:hypothetical protein